MKKDEEKGAEDMTRYAKKIRKVVIGVLNELNKKGLFHIYYDHERHRNDYVDVVSFFQENTRIGNFGGEGQQSLVFPWMEEILVFRRGSYNKRGLWKICAGERNEEIKKIIKKELRKKKLLMGDNIIKMLEYEDIFP